MFELKGAADDDVDKEAETIAEAGETAVVVLEELGVVVVGDETGKDKDKPGVGLLLGREGSGEYVDGDDGLFEYCEARDLVTETGGAVVTTMELGVSS